MKKLLATFAVCMAFSMPAMATDFFWADGVVSSFNGESSQARAERLFAEIEDLGMNGGQHGQRWNTIVEAAAKEGWASQLNDHITSMGLLPNVSTYNAWKDYFVGNHAAYVALFDPATTDEINTDFMEAFEAATETTTSASHTYFDGNSWSIQHNTYTIGGVDLEFTSQYESHIDTAVDKALKEAIEKSFNAGYDKGFKAGYKEGWKDAEAHHGIN